MNTNQRITIGDLSALGHELSEEHLRLAAGSELKKTLGWDRTGCSNNTCWDTYYKQV